MEGDPYEEQLLAVFESCDVEGRGALDGAGLCRLCETLHLGESAEELVSRLPPLVTFSTFREALLALLAARDPSPVREVSPKFVYGQKKYGRRSRPESTDQDGGCQDITIEEADADAFLVPVHATQNGNSCPSPDILAERLEGINDGLNSTVTPVSEKETEVGTGEAELRAAWERLGVGRDGFLHRNELAMVCSAVGMDTLADQVVTQVFCKLNRDEDGRIGFEEFLQLFRSRAESPRSLPTSPPNSDFQGTSPDPYVKSPSMADLWDSAGMSGARLLQDLQAARSLLESVTEERDKLRNDLADANHRAAVLAQEVDEHHARIEKATRNKVKLLETKHSEEIKELKRVTASEREQLSVTNQRLETEVAIHLDQISKLNSQLATLKKEFEGLEKENRILGDRLRENEQASVELQKQVECMDALHQRVMELESAEESSSSLKEKLAKLHLENTELRDRNDELTIQIEAFSSRSLQRREGSWEGGGGGGTKRRGKSPPGDWMDSHTPRFGKVRRCCTENDLTSSQARSLGRRLQHSESGLESDFDTLTGSPTPSGGSLENGGRDEIEQLRAYISELELKLEQFQMKGWDLSKLNCSDDDSLPCASTLKSEVTQVTYTSISSTSDASCKSLEADKENELNCSPRSETATVEVQTVPGDLSEKERAQLETLEKIKEEILKIISEKKACSKENCLLKQHIADIMNRTLGSDELRLNKDGDGASLSFPFMDIDVFDSIEKYDLNGGPEQITKFDKLSQFAFEFVEVNEEAEASPTLNHAKEDSPGSVAQKPSQEIEFLRDEKDRLAERCAQLETSLELMRVEYEKTEDYWANKLEEERRLFELDQQQSDEKFAELEVKIQEYAEMLSAEQGKKQALPPIEERDYLEKQFTDLEEEYESYRMAVQDQLAQKDNEIESLKQALSVFNISSGPDSNKNVEVQTDEVSRSTLEMKSYPSSSSQDKDERPSKGEGCCCSCHDWDRREIRRWRDFKASLKSECELLTQQKQKLIFDISTLHHTSNQLNTRDMQIMQSLNGRLKQQVMKCRQLQNALRHQHKHTETLLQKNWERHHTDLTTIQDSLKQTQEKLQRQAILIKQQVEKLAAADLLVKNLFVENSRLMLALTRLEEKCQSDSQLCNSF